MTAPKHEFTFTYDREFIRRALRRDWAWRGYVVVGAALVMGAGMGS